MLLLLLVVLVKLKTKIVLNNFFHLRRNLNIKIKNHCFIFLEKIVGNRTTKYFDLSKKYLIRYFLEK